MRTILLLSIGAIASPCMAQDASVDIGGTTVTIGMLRETLEAAIQTPYRLGCWTPPPEDARGNGAEDCLVTNGGNQVGEIGLQDGRVEYAARHWRQFNDPEAHELAILLHDLLAELTQGNDTCVMIRTGTPPRQTLLVLPKAMGWTPPHL